MGPYVLQRLVYSALVLLLLSAITFAIIQVAPGGPSVLVNPDISAQDAARIRRNLGLDRSLPVQYLDWLRTLIRGDFGRSFIDGRPVLSELLERLPNTLELSGAAVVLAIVVGLIAGGIAAIRPNSLFDRATMLVSVIGVSVPLFWLALMSVLLLSVRWHLFPSAGMSNSVTGGSVEDNLYHLILPAAVLSTVYMPQIARYMRSSMLQVLVQDYVRVAYAKGLTRRSVLVGHAARNAFMPVLTIIGLTIPALVGGAAITETIFSWPGMGRLAVDAAFRRDFPMIMGITVVFSAIVLLSNLLVDVAYAWLDPRIRF
jgi:peptide/nickel transport system permease protein